MGTSICNFTRKRGDKKINNTTEKNGENYLKILKTMFKF
jgi:hypothetical protein